MNIIKDLITNIEEVETDENDKITVNVVINHNKNAALGMSLKKEDKYTISEFIELLEEAKRKFGDKPLIFGSTKNKQLNKKAVIFDNYQDINELDTSDICVYIFD